MRSLHWAVINGHYDCVQLLIQAGADVDIKSNVSTLDIHTIILNILMIYHIDVTQDGRTALHCAVRAGHDDCAQLLIQSGADVDMKNRVSTLYVYTVYHDRDKSY